MLSWAHRLASLQPMEILQTLSSGREDAHIPHQWGHHFIHKAVWPVFSFFFVFCFFRWESVGSEGFIILNLSRREPITNSGWELPQCSTNHRALRVWIKPAPSSYRNPNEWGKALAMIYVGIGQWGAAEWQRDACCSRSGVEVGVALQIRLDKCWRVCGGVGVCASVCDATTSL